MDTSTFAKELANKIALFAVAAFVFGYLLGSGTTVYVLWDKLRW